MSYRRSFPGSTPALSSYNNTKTTSTPDLSTPEFWEAVNTKNLTTAWRLLLAGTNPNVKEETTGQTPLHVVCQDGNVALAMLLFTRGGDINARDNAGQTPLHKAAMCGHLQIVTFLIKADAKTDVLDKMNRSAEELAFQHGHLPIFRLLVGVKGGGEKRSSMISAISTSTAKAMRKEEEKRDKEQKKLEKAERKLVEKESEIKDKIDSLTLERERLQAIPEAQLTKKEKLSLHQINNKLTKLQAKCDQNTDKIRIVRSTSFDNHPTGDKGQAWIDFVKHN